MCVCVQLEELTQTARQAVTVALRALAQLRKAALDAARDRDRLGTQGRLVMRRAAVQVRSSSVETQWTSSACKAVTSLHCSQLLSLKPTSSGMLPAQALIGSTRTLLCDLSYFYGLTDGQTGRTLSRRMQNLLKVKA